MAHTTQEIADHVGGTLEGPGDLPITGVDALEKAGEGDLTFIREQVLADRWADCRAAVALIGPDVEIDAGAGRTLIRVKDADLAIAQVLELFAPPVPRPQPGVHPTAIVDPAAQLGAEVAIGPGAVIGARTCIGDRAVIHANVTISEDVTIGAGTEIWPGTMIRERCRIGSGCILHANVTIGTDGFGYRPAPVGRGLIKIPQIGTVEIGDGVEIGAGSCVDRGKFAATVIGDGCKLDNMVQIAHNCELGRCVVIAGCSALAGSVKIGDGAVLGGDVGIKDNVEIGAGATIAGATSVMSDVPPGEIWVGYPARPVKMARLEYAAIRRLPELLKQARKFMK